MTPSDSSNDVAFLPDWRKGNPYQSLLANALIAHGQRVRFHPMPRGLFALNRLPAEVRSRKVVHLHWINQLIAHLVLPQNPLLRRLKWLLLGLDVWLLRARGARVVWTVHNLVSHESKDPVSETKARRLLARCCSRLLVHSGSALRELEMQWGMDLSRKASIVPHGNYDGCYPSTLGETDRLRERLGVPAQSLCLLFFGAVRQYKGLLPLVHAMRTVNRQDVCLVIAGRPHEVALKAQLEEAVAADKRVILALDFIPDDAVASYFDMAHAVVVPFERTLTSGSVVLAMTLGKATLLPEKAKVFDLASEETSWFFDTMDDLSAMVEGLQAADVLERGRRARLVAETLAWSEIARSVKRVYARQ